jgi:hypothetical protein
VTRSKAKPKAGVEKKVKEAAKEEIKKEVVKRAGGAGGVADLKILNEKAKLNECCMFCNNRVFSEAVKAGDTA